MATLMIKQRRYENQTASGQNKIGPSPDRWKLRAKTYPLIAEAMADQWIAYIDRYPLTLT